MALIYLAAELFVFLQRCIMMTILNKRTILSQEFHLICHSKKTNVQQLSLCHLSIVAKQTLADVYLDRLRHLKWAIVARSM